MKQKKHKTAQISKAYNGVTLKERISHSWLYFSGNDKYGKLSLA
jgi:hypothetical protein